MHGCGVGGSRSRIIALVVEFSASRSLALVIASWVSCFPRGVALVRIPCIFLVTRFDCPSVFILGGVAAFMLLPFLYWGIPDSPSFLMRSKAPAEDVRRELSRVLNRPVEHALRMQLAEQHSEGGTLRAISLYENDST